MKPMIPEEENNTSKETFKLSFKWFLKSFSSLLVDTFTLRKGADIQGTIETIRRDSDITGHNIWILIFSIFIASIGLNINSPAVVIGAMLISPLMGPILGIGLSLSTNDGKTLVVSFRNFIVMMIVAMGTSYIYFKISPFHEAQSELLARTKPQLLDAFVAIFGGLAGIIGNSRKERSNVVPGVAIATALMPPLCTAGYGLSVGNYDYFLGAFYLFLLNSAMICITTVIVVQYMKFPKVKYVDRAKERKTKTVIAFIAFIVIIPSFFMFYNVLQENRFTQNAYRFIRNEINYEKCFLVKESIKYDKNDTREIELLFVGTPIDSLEIDRLKRVLESYSLHNTNLSIQQGDDAQKIIENEKQAFSNAAVDYENKLTEANTTIIQQDQQIRELESQLTLFKADTFPITSLQIETKHVFPEIAQITFAKSFYVDSSTIKTTPTLLVAWDKKSRLKTSKKKEIQSKLYDWMKYKLKADTVKIMVE